MRREWLMVLLVVILLVPVGCGTTAKPRTETATVGSALSVSETYTVQVTPVFNEPPKADIRQVPGPQGAGQPVEFSADGSTDPDGHIVKYEWDFGDGTTEETSVPYVTHVYAAPGTYEVTLTVTDNGGGIASTVWPSEEQPIDGYTVQPGDTLMEISRKLFNGDHQYWDDIADLNGIKAPYTIYPGQKLKVPEK